MKDASFEVKQGEVLGIIGPNGAGKSTLLKILSRITEPTSGRAEVFGRVASLLEVGTGFHKEMTGRENIYLNGAILGMNKTEIDIKFDEIVDFSGVEKFIDTPVKRYSSGMYVRLAFAVAAQLEPEILLVDEVLAVGDADFQRKCLSRMDDVAQSGRTVFFVSHNLPSVRKLCTRGILLMNGSITYDGMASDSIDKYLSGLQIRQRRGDTLKSSRARSEVVDLKFLRVVDAQGKEAKTFKSDEPITIEIGYQVKTNVQDLLTKVIFNDAQGNPFLATIDLDYPTEANYRVKDPGFYVSKCIIPPDTFGTNTITLDLIITERKKMPYYIDLRKVMSFETILVHSSSKNYGDSYGIALRPHFPWQISKTDELV